MKVEIIKNIQPEMKNTITEMKNTLQGINRRTDKGVKHISNLEDK